MARMKVYSLYFIKRIIMKRFDPNLTDKKFVERKLILILASKNFFT